MIPGCRTIAERAPACRRRPFRAGRDVLFAGILVLLAVSPSAPATPPPAKTEGAPPATTTRRLPEDITLEAVRIEQTGPTSYRLEGEVTIKSRRARIQADRVVIRENRYIDGEGNVLLVWGANRISGTRVKYDLEADRGTLEDAMGQVEPDFFFVSRTVEKVGKDLVHLEHATVTTCTQPRPYWSFSVSSATIHIDHYARMWNPRLRAGPVPIFYLPYLIWPVKRDRAAGLLFPSFGSSRNRGRVLHEELFLPLGRSADLTLYGEYYSLAGMGWGGQFNIIPNQAGSATFDGFFIQDQVSGTFRYRAAFRETQQFLNGFRMVADINQVSDFGYFNDFERDLSIVSLPTILARLEFTRNGSWTSVNVRELRREQLFSDGTSKLEEVLPEIEFRGRNRRIGKTPLYIGYESSLALVRQRSDQERFVGSTTLDFPLKTDYRRADVFPTLSMAVSPVSWLDITPSMSYRWTYYTQHQDTTTLEIQSDGLTVPVTVDQIKNEPLTRGVMSAGVEIVGPKFFRIYDRPKSAFSKRYKHVVEGYLAYAFQQAFDRANEVILYDEVDPSRSATNQVTYGMRTRLFAQRPRVKPQEPTHGTEAILLPQGSTGEVKEAPPEAETPSAGGHETKEAPAPMEPVEIASFEIRQSHSFQRFLNSGDVRGNGVIEQSRFSQIEAVGRFNPSRTMSFDLRSHYDPLFKTMADVSLSGNVGKDAAHTSFSIVRTTAIRGAQGNTQLRLTSGVSFLSGKIRLDVDGSYDGSERKIRDQRWRAEFYTQCCGFLVEYLARDYTAIAQRGDWHFSVDLRGIGKLLDWSR